jgi:hypothetical protein
MLCSLSAAATPRPFCQTSLTQCGCQPCCFLVLIRRKSRIHLRDISLKIRSQHGFQRMANRPMPVIFHPASHTAYDRRARARYPHRFQRRRSCHIPRHSTLRAPIRDDPRRPPHLPDRPGRTRDGRDVHQARGLARRRRARLFCRRACGHGRGAGRPGLMVSRKPCARARRGSRQSRALQPLRRGRLGVGTRARRLRSVSSALSGDLVR